MIAPIYKVYRSRRFMFSAKRTDLRQHNDGHYCKPRDIMEWLQRPAEEG